MAKRRPPNDDQWDRTSGGVIVPRRGVSLPTRRWIGWMGGAKDCCEETTCGIWSITRPASVQFALSGIADVPGCSYCDDHNIGTTTATYYNHSFSSASCWDEYVYTEAGIPYRTWYVDFTHYFKDKYWQIFITTVKQDCSYNYVEVHTQQLSSAIESGTYSMEYFYSTASCDGSNAEGFVIVP